MISVFCDGGSRANPGHAAYGFLVKVAGLIVHQEGSYIGIATNNFAEYTALIKALEWLKQKYEGNDLDIFLDSNLVVSQLSGIFKVKNAQIRELVMQVRVLETSFGSIRYHFIPRAQNQAADALVNEALDKQMFKSY